MPRDQLIQIRRDTNANWSTVNPVLAEGEPGYDISTGYLRIGNGASAFSELPIFTHGKNIDPIGIEWDTLSTSTTLKRIDVNGNEVTSVDSLWFDNHIIWGNIRRCVINPTTGVITYGYNARGDGLDLTGASGNVMVRVNKFYVKSEFAGTVCRWWVSAVPIVGFELHPAFVQRGGAEVEAVFVSAYEASGFLDGTTFKLQSATGKQPVTGAVSYPDLPNSGRLYIGDAETYANNIGTGYGIMNVWTLSALRTLFYIEYANLNSQTALGRGVVDLASGTDFAGLLTGAHSSDTNIGINGTGSGTGTNGQTPIVYRGIENMWGNVNKWTIGINFNDTNHMIVKADGTGTLAPILTAGNYDLSASVPLNTTDNANGYGSNVFTDDVLKYNMITSATAGSSDTYLADYAYVRTKGSSTTCLLFGGYWNDASLAGVGSLYSVNGASYSSRSRGARLEFYKR